RGGVTVGSASDSLQSIHWGFGLGETVGSAKLSFEYAAAKEFPNGFGANFERPHETYHRFAFHHSFESIEVNANGRVTPLRFTERYTHRYRFARELAPREIIADTVATLAYEPSDYKAALQAVGASGANSAALTAEPVAAEGVQAAQAPKSPSTIVGRHIVAIFPVSFEVVAGRVSNVGIKEKVRGNFLIALNRSGAGRPVAPDKLQSAPAQGQRESEAAYLARLQQALGADLIVFSKLYANGLSGELKLVVLYYLRGDNGISARDEIEGMDVREPQFIDEATQKFRTTHKTLLEELK
ncbi:MAG: hypothetical protein ONA90_01140, partial [candidate division KSB1 bacterium]|nr:hypothetical protein [candidate division KSB1 bacterium]